MLSTTHDENFSGTMIPRSEPVSVLDKTVTFGSSAPKTYDQWCTALLDVKTIHQKKQYKACEERCNELLALGDMNGSLRSLQKAFLLFYRAIALESAARATHNFSARKLPLLEEAHDAYFEAEKYISTMIRCAREVVEGEEGEEEAATADEVKTGQEQVTDAIEAHDEGSEASYESDAAEEESEDDGQEAEEDNEDSLIRQIDSMTRGFLSSSSRTNMPRVPRTISLDLSVLAVRPLELPSQPTIKEDDETVVQPPPHPFLFRNKRSAVPASPFNPRALQSWDEEGPFQDKKTVDPASKTENDGNTNFMKNRIIASMADGNTMPISQAWHAKEDNTVKPKLLPAINFSKKSSVAEPPIDMPPPFMTTTGAFDNATPASNSSRSSVIYWIPDPPPSSDPHVQLFSCLLDRIHTYHLPELSDQIAVFKANNSNKRMTTEASYWSFKPSIAPLSVKAKNGEQEEKQESQAKKPEPVHTDDDNGSGSSSWTFTDMKSVPAGSRGREQRMVEGRKKEWKRDRSVWQKQLKRARKLVDDAWADINNL